MVLRLPSALGGGQERYKPFSAFLISQASPHVREAHPEPPAPTQELAMGFSEWEGICLPMQETGVQSLTWEYPTCCGSTKPLPYNCRACALEPRSRDF